MKNLKNNFGITLVALSTTIIILLILAGISIGVLTGENGLIQKTNKAKEQSEIANEKEIVDLATIKAMEKDRYGNISKENLQNELNNNLEEHTEVLSDEKDLYVHFVNNDRYYSVDKNGDISRTCLSR